MNMTRREESVPPDAALSSTQEGRRKVIVVDDSPFTLATTQEYLAGCGYDVRTGSSLDVFEQQMCGWVPDIILTDVRMPGMSGSALCTFLKNRTETSHVLVILFSSLSDSELEVLASRCGADGYFSKRQGMQRLGEHVESLCAEVLW